VFENRAPEHEFGLHAARTVGAPRRLVHLADAVGQPGVADRSGLATPAIDRLLADPQVPRQIDDLPSSVTLDKPRAAV
jgi:hypothetical protein